jgi:hypothetical protein
MTGAMQALRLRFIAYLAGLLGVCLAPARAGADASQKIDMAGVYFPMGINVGTALRDPGKNGVLLGAELSGVYLWHEDDYTFLGGYVDLLRDFGLGASRLSFGPEVGSHYCGIDGGPVFAWEEGWHHAGWRARLFGTLAFVSLYLGEWRQPGGNWSTEIGLLLKVPTLNYSERKGLTFDM